MFRRHHQEMPFAKAMSEVCQERVIERGEIRTLLGRRVRFPLYEPARWDARDKRMFPLWKAKQVWPGERLQRARLHKALNSLIQPSAADQTKKAMLDLMRAGLGPRVLVQVHDELCLSVPDEPTATSVAEIMRNAVDLTVPVRTGVTLGPTWGDPGGPIHEA